MPYNPEDHYDDNPPSAEHHWLSAKTYNRIMVAMIVIAVIVFSVLAIIDFVHISNHDPMIFAAVSPYMTVLDIIVILGAVLSWCLIVLALMTGL